MLHIRPHQIKAFEDAQLLRYKKKLCRFVTEEFPELVDNVNADKTHDSIGTLVDEIMGGVFATKTA